jgi:hypothetical protein
VDARLRLPLPPRVRQGALRSVLPRSLSPPSCRPNPLGLSRISGTPRSSRGPCRRLSSHFRPTPAPGSPGTRSAGRRGWGPAGRSGHLSSSASESAVHGQGM